MPPRKAKPVLNRLTGLLCLVAAVGIGCFALGSLPPRKLSSPWLGFRSLLVEDSVPESQVLASLRAAGIREIVSESTEPVQISNWAGLETLSLGAARLCLVPGDPRFDDYLQRLGLWFSAKAGGKDYRAYYIKEAPALGAGQPSDRAIAKALSAYEGLYLLPGEGAARLASGPAFIAAACLLLLLASIAGPLIGRGASLSRGLATRKPLRLSLDRIALRLCLALPWALLAWGGFPAAGPALLCALAIVEAADRLDLPIDEYRRGRGLRSALVSLAGQEAPALALPIAAVLAAGAHPSLLSSLALALIGSLAALAGWMLFSGRPQARPVFVPLPIGRSSFFSRRAVSAAGSSRAVLACCLLLLWSLASLLPASEGSGVSSEVELPLPVAVQGSLRPLVAEARQRALVEAPGLPPGLPSYLEHRARQEALPFARLGEKRGDPFAPALLPLPEGRSQPGPGASGVEFNDGWARTAYSELPALSVEGILLRQGSATVARLSPLGSEVGRHLAPIEYLLYIFLLIPPIGRILTGVPNARGVASGKLGQEA